MNKASINILDHLYLQNDVQVFSIDISKDYEKVNDVMEKVRYDWSFTFSSFQAYVHCFFSLYYFLLNCELNDSFFINIHIFLKQSFPSL